VRLIVSLPSGSILYISQFPSRLESNVIVHGWGSGVVVGTGTDVKVDVGSFTGCGVFTAICVSGVAIEVQAATKNRIIPIKYWIENNLFFIAILLDSFVHVHIPHLAVLAAARL
jgi:hypothetical protein